MNKDDKDLYNLCCPYENKSKSKKNINKLVKLMEEMANEPRDTKPYVRQPGEKCMYEIQRIENRKNIQ